MDHIRVVIRVRPLNGREVNSEQFSAWMVNGNALVQCGANGRAVVSTPAYPFDRIFLPENKNAEVYNDVARDVVLSAVEGINGTIFTYGQTSSGKTHTMLGTKDEPGIIPLAISDIFNHVSKTPNREFLLRVSYIELYNESIRDLLQPENDNLKIHETVHREIFVGNLTEEIVLTADAVLSLMASGEEHRRFGVTNMNERSSRSHTIFKMVIESRERSVETGDSAVRVASLNLVDLAGSERVRHTGAEGLRLKEGGHINKSLLTLASVIAKLSDGNDRVFVPFRDSKLTRILQPSLGGNAKTVVIATITPASNYVDETHSTLKFASRAKEIKNKPQVNEVLSEEALMKRYQNEITALRRQLSEVSSVGISEEIHQLATQKQMMEQQNMLISHQLQEKEKQENVLLEKLQKLQTLILNSSSDSVPFDAEKRRPKKQVINRRQTWFPGMRSHKDLVSEDDMINETAISTPQSTNVTTTPQTAVSHFRLSLTPNDSPSNEDVDALWMVKIDSEQVATLRLALKRTEQQLIQQAQESASTIAFMQAEHQALLAEKANDKRIIEELSALNADMCAKSTSLHQVVEELQANTEALAQLRTTIKKEENTLHQLTLQQDTTLAAIQKADDELVVSMREAAACLNTTRDSLADLQSRVAAETTHLQQLDAEKQALIASIESLEREVSDRTNIASDRLVALNDDIESKSASLQQISSELQATIHSSATESAKLDQLIQYKANLASSIQVLETEYDSKLLSLSLKSTSLHQVIEELQANTEALAQLRTTIKKEENTLHQLTLQQDTTLAAIQKAEDELMSMKEAAACLNTTRDSIADLQSRVAAETTHLRQLDAEKQALNDDIASKSASLQQISSELQATINSSATESAKLDQLIQYKADLVSSIQVLESEYDSKLLSLRQISSELNTKANSYAKLDVQLATEASELDQLVKHEATVKASIQALDSKAAQMNEKLSVLENNLSLKSTSLHQVIEELQANTEALAQLRTTIKKEENTLHQLTRQQDTTLAAIQKAEDELVSMREATACLNTSRDSLADLQSRVAVETTHLRQLDSEKQALIASIKSLKDEISDHTNIANDLNDDIASKSASLQQISSELQATIQSSATESAKLDQLIQHKADLVSSIQVLEAEHASKATQLSALSSDLISKSASLHQVVDDLHTKSEALNGLEQTKKKTLSEVEKQLQNKLFMLEQVKSATIQESQHKENTENSKQGQPSNAKQDTNDTTNNVPRVSRRIQRALAASKARDNNISEEDQIPECNQQ